MKKSQNNIYKSKQTNKQITFMAPFNLNIIDIIDWVRLLMAGVEVLKGSLIYWKRMK